ncbi:hypothetical protein USB125703_00159 [Pseudoclavibacter triregionum]|nr:hypothetical protein USB125703_00159 [Pseudoclavibacter triregionum]
MRALYGTVQVTWGPREESPEELGERLRFLLEELAPFSEFARGPWTVLDGGRSGDVPSEEPSADDAVHRSDVRLDSLGEMLAGRPRTDDRGRPWEGRGWSAALYAGPAFELHLSVGGGATQPVRRVAFNRCTLTASEGFPEDAFRGFAESNLIAMVDAFEPHYGSAYSAVQLEGEQTLGLRPRIGAVTYVADDFARVPAELEGATRARHHEGTLLRLDPKPGESLWTDTAPVERVVRQLDALGWEPSLRDLSPRA